MKIGIYCGVDVGFIRDRDIDYIGVDKGVEYLLKQGIQPVLAIGDMDSLEDHALLEKLDIQQFSPIKDDTDTALALKYAFSKGYDEIDLYGVTQKRMDHFLAVICLLEKYQDKHIVIYDQYNQIQVLLPGIHRIEKNDTHYFSLFAFDESIITLKNCHYPLDHYLLKRNDPLCVSNQMTSTYTMIETSQPILLILSQ